VALRIILAVLVGGGIGLAVGMLGRSTGGQCLILCNPYVSTAVGVMVGLVLAARSEPAELEPPGASVQPLDSEAAFEEAVSGPGAAAVEFYTARCPACRAQMPALAEAADRFAGRVSVAMVNAHSVPGAVRRFRVRGVPALLLFRDGELVGRLEGRHSAEELAQAFRRLAEPAADAPEAPA
jgi:thiol-disulfide isomerase/thioredoxin